MLCILHSSTLQKQQTFAWHTFDSKHDAFAHQQILFPGFPPELMIPGLVFKGCLTVVVKAAHVVFHFSLETNVYIEVVAVL